MAGLWWLRRNEGESKAQKQRTQAATWVGGFRLQLLPGRRKSASKHHKPSKQLADLGQGMVMVMLLLLDGPVSESCPKSAEFYLIFQPSGR